MQHSQGERSALTGRKNSDCSVRKLSEVIWWLQHLEMVIWLSRGQLGEGLGIRRMTHRPRFIGPSKEVGRVLWTKERTSRGTQGPV